MQAGQMGGSSRNRLIFTGEGKKGLDFAIVVVTYLHHVCHQIPGKDFGVLEMDARWYKMYTMTCLVSIDSIQILPLDHATIYCFARTYILLISVTLSHDIHGWHILVAILVQRALVANLIG